MNQLTRIAQSENQNPLSLADSSTQQKIGMSQAMAMVSMQFQAAAMIPRDVEQCTLDLVEACKDLDFVEQSSILYAWNVSGKTVCGPGIRLLEEAARCYGSLGFEWQIIDDGPGWSIIKTTAIDFKKNIMASRTFKVKHGTMKKAWNDDGSPVLDKQKKQITEFVPETNEDQIYVRCANYAARRKRTCLEEVMPKIMLTKAFKAAQETLKTANKTPMPLRIAAAFDSLDKDFGIAREVIEGKYKKPFAEFDGTDYVELRAIYGAIKAEPSKKIEFFPALAPKAPEVVNPTAAAPAAQEAAPPKPAEAVAESAKEPPASSTTADATKPEKEKAKKPKKNTELASEEKAPPITQTVVTSQSTEAVKEPEQSAPPVVTPQGLPETSESFLDDDDLDSIGGFSS